MGYKESISLTELGLKNIYRYLLLHFSIILVLLIISTAFSFYQQNLLSLSASKLFFVVTIVLLNIMIFIWLIIGLKNVLNGRMEFSDPHESYVLLSTALIIVYIVLYFINLFLAQGFTGGTTFVAATSNNFSSSISFQFFLVILLSILSDLLFGISLIFFLRNLTTKNQMTNLKIAFFFLVLGTFTINITSLIAYLLFFKIYKGVYLNIKKGELKPAIIAPCPFCSSEIPIESKICKFCGAMFEQKNSNEKNIKLDFNIPKSVYVFKKGNLPVQKLSKNSKIKLFYFIGFIILSIFIGLLLVLFI